MLNENGKKNVRVYIERVSWRKNKLQNFRDFQLKADLGIARSWKHADASI